MNFAERTKWTEALLACSVIRDRKRRDTIVDELPADMRSRIQRDETDNVDVMNILKRVLEFDGVTQFIQIVAFYEGESLPMQAVQLLHEETYITISTTENAPTIWTNDKTLQALQYPVLDRREPVAIFQKLLDPNTPYRFMRLLGAAKMGKSHLLTKVFPDLAQQQNARSIIMDLRGKQEAMDWLYHISTQLGIANCPTFDHAYQEWISRPPLQAEELQALISSLGRQERQDDPAKRVIPHLTRTLVEDLRCLNERSIVLLCDAVDEADANVQEWLMNMLLVQLQPLPHIHVVVGGRKLPEAAGNYDAICQSYELQPVKEKDAYIRYCSEIEAELDEGQVDVLAYAIEYAPGAFVDIVHKLSAERRFAHV